MQLVDLHKKISKAEPLVDIPAMEKKLLGIIKSNDDLQYYVALSASEGLSYESLAGRLGVSVAGLQKMITDSKELFEAYTMGVQLYVARLEKELADLLTGNTEYSNTQSIKRIDQLGRFVKQHTTTLASLTAKYAAGELAPATATASKHRSELW